VTPTDAALVDQLARGDAGALEAVIARYGPRLMRYASHSLRSTADADEVLQDVFLRAERAVRRGTRPNQLANWLFRITVNRCRSRQRRWWPFVTGVAADHAMAAAAITPDTDASEWREEIDRALAMLSPRLREAFLLRYVEGMSYEEIAAVSGAGISALKMRAARACEQLRAQLGELRQ
jgi:RNA polymerase sigma-70 factor (ECF subfamily)